jgi:N-acetyl sugar amidotransferase
MDTTDPNITFNEQGVCSRCEQFYNDILPSWNYGKDKETELKILLDKIKEEGKNKPYDCLLGLSGGLDSTYLLHLAVKEFGLRPLVFHVDAGWNSPMAISNIQNIVQKLNISLHTEKINFKEMQAIQLAFFRAGVSHLDIPQDNAFVEILDNYAKKHNIKYILNGGNISTEVVVNPTSWVYWGTDARQNKDIIKKFSPIKIKHYKFTNVIKRKLIMPYVYRVKIVKPLNVLPYVKNDVLNLLAKEYNYEYYGQKHFESLMTKFIEGYWLPKRFGFDVRKPQLSSLILTNQLTRYEALSIIQKDPLSEKDGKELFSLIAKMLEVSEIELESYLTMPIKQYTDYKHYNWLFSIGSKAMYTMKLDKLIRK